MENVEVPQAKKILAYCRVSSERMRKELKSQINRLKTYAKKNNLEIVMMKEEYCAGNNTCNPYSAFLLVLDEAKKMKYDIYMAAPIVLTTEVGDAIKIHDSCVLHGIKIIFISDPELFDNEDAYLETYRTMAPLRKRNDPR